jgi:Mn2+/Fe2+ NRAMP family transporter
MINAAVLGTTAISLSSAWAYGKVKGWPHSLEMPVSKAKGFYATYVVCVALAAAIVLIPGAPLQLIIIGVQVLAGIMLPSAIIFLQLLLNDKQVLGDEYVNQPEQLGELDHHHCPLHSFTHSGGPGGRPQPVPCNLRKRGEAQT